MKKLIILLLAVIFSCGSFVSCSNEQNTESSVNNTDDSLSESSIEPSEEVKIPEKVVYFTGDYDFLDYSEYGGLEFCKDSNAREGYSCEYPVTKDGLVKYLENNEVDGNTYFLVGVYVQNAKIEESREFLDDYLKQFDFLVIEDHPMLFDMEYVNEWYAVTNFDEYEAIDYKYIQKKLPDLDLNEYNINDKTRSINLCRFTNVGYISADALKAIAEDTELDRAILFTWFPAPDDQERWLTFGTD